MAEANIIGIVNQKGGTGKTTSCVNLGIDLAREGKKVLIADCDPQGSATISLGHSQPDALPVTLSDLMVKVLNDVPLPCLPANNRRADDFSTWLLLISFSPCSRNA